MDKLTDLLAHPTIRTILMGLLGYFIVQVIIRTSQKVQNWLYSISNNFSVNGVWVTDFISEGKHVIEIYMLREQKPRNNSGNINIKFNFQHWKNRGGYNVMRGTGNGVRNLQKIVLVYSSIEKYKNGIGALILKSFEDPSRIVLKGNFYEYFNSKIRSSNNYEIVLRKIELPLLMRFKLKLNKKIFDRYEDARSFISNFENHDLIK